MPLIGEQVLTLDFEIWNLYFIENIFLRIDLIEVEYDLPHLIRQAWAQILPMK